MKRMLPVLISACSVSMISAPIYASPMTVKVVEYDSPAVARKLKLARKPSLTGFVLGRASGKVAAGATRTFKIRLTAKSRRALRHARSVALSARVTASGPAGTPRPVTVRRTLR